MSDNTWTRLTTESYADFSLRFEQGEFGSQRFGQAAINHFGLRTDVEPSSPIYGLWEADKADAMAMLVTALGLYQA